ncbi:hypothetical protein QBC36DRAFT_193872, partial [Triangularia setosa]
GSWKEAGSLEVETMGTRKRILVEDYPGLLSGMNKLASTWKSQSRLGNDNVTYNEGAKNWKMSSSKIIYTPPVLAPLLSPTHPFALRKEGARLITPFLFFQKEIADSLGVVAARGLRTPGKK